MACGTVSSRTTRAFQASRNAPRPSRRNIRVRGAQPSPEELAKAMQDPAVRERMKAMEEAMKRPEVQQQMAEMQQYMQNQQLQQRLQELKSDPEFAEMFEEIKKGGMAAMMKYMNDPKTLAKLGEKLGDIDPNGGAGPAAAAAAPPSMGAGAAPPMPEVTNLLEAARYGDMEAVEDFLAIGKDVNMADNEGRTPLHYAVAYNQGAIARMLLEAGAKLEAQDSKQNTPLHYAAGYGRAPEVLLLLEAGASTKATNSTGKTPAELITMEPRNPLNNDAELLKKLSA